MRGTVADMGPIVLARGTPVAGRAAELTRLAQRIQGAAQGQPCALLVHGEAGVGKTRLVTEICADAAARGFTVLWGRCVHFGAASSPYASIVAALSDWLGSAPQEHRVEVLADLDVVADGTVGSERVLRVVERSLARIASYGPLVLVVDDVHWADITSLDVLAYLITGFRDQPMAVVATFRDTDLPDGHPLFGWLADLRRLPEVLDVELDRLSEAGTSEQLAGLLGGSPQPELVQQVHRRSGGNPYLSELLVQDLSADQTTLPPGLPAGLRDVLLATWHRLSAPTREVTRLLGVGGRPLPFATLAAVGELRGMQQETVAASLRTATRAGVLQVEQGDAYWFRHPLLAEVLYETLVPGEAAPLHAAFVDVLERRAARDEAEQMRLLADLAVHHERSGAVDRAFEYSIAAAEHAGRLQGHPEQATHLVRAVDLLPRVQVAAVRDAGGETALLERAAYACSRSGDPLAAHRLVTRALTRVDRDHDPATATRLLTEWCELVWVNGMVERPPLAQHLEAVELSSVLPDSAAHAVALARLAEAECWSGLRDRAEHHVERAVAVAERSRAAVAMATALGARSFVQVRRETAWEDSEAAYAWARRSRDPLVVAAACAHRIAYLEQHGRVHELLPVEAEGFALSTATGARGFQALFAGTAALDAMRLGLFEDSRVWAREGLACRSVGHGAVQVRRAAATLAVREGRLTEAGHHIDRLRELSPAFESRVGAQGPVLLAEYHLACGDTDAAHAVVERTLAAHTTADPRVGDVLLLWGARAAADLARSGRDSGEHATVAEARRRLDNLIEVRRAVAAPLFRPTDAGDLLPPALEALFEAESARCRTTHGSPAAWQTAVAACAAAGLRWEEAVASQWLGRSLLESGGHRTAAADAVRSAHRLATAMGAQPLADDLTGLARSARISLAPIVEQRDPHRDGSLLGSLTKREREVLAHLVAGRSYGEVARALFISEKTVSVHVSHLLRKTGTANRSEAAALARRHGVVAEEE